MTERAADLPDTSGKLSSSPTTDDFRRSPFSFSPPPTGVLTSLYTTLESPNLE